jgi:hypothetical protein
MSPIVPDIGSRYLFPILARSVSPDPQRSKDRLDQVPGAVGLEGLSGHQPSVDDWSQEGERPKLGIDVVGNVADSNAVGAENLIRRIWRYPSRQADRPGPML